MPNKLLKGLFVYGEDVFELRKITANAPIYYWHGFEANNNDLVASDLLRSTTCSTFTVHFRGQESWAIPHSNFRSPQHR